MRGLNSFAESVVVPFAHTVGDVWALGILPVAAEYLASEVLVQALKKEFAIPGVQDRW